MFRCVLDSGWVDVDSLTALVGKNEAGKTSLLRALHKFNPFEPESYSIPREWPRSQRDERSDAQVVCSVEFELDEHELKELKQITTDSVQSTKVVVTRDYAGRFAVSLPEPEVSEAPEMPESSPAERTAPAPLPPKAHEYIVSRLPTIVYMDEYKTFAGTAFLDQVKQRKDLGKLTEEDETLVAILHLAELDLDEEVKKGVHQDREERQYDLNDAAATLNRKIASHWKQLRYEVDFRADGHQFMTFVKGSEDKTLIRLEERSKGFQWFFSFDLMLMHETQGTLKNCVILLDEPGLHLHPAAQLDLLARLNDYARGNTVIYSTHLPFMIELRNPERIRVISEMGKGTVVREDLTETESDAKLVLQAALGIGGSTSHLVADQNIVVEGVDDYWTLTALSDLFQRSARQGLPPDILITPAGGKSEATYIATFMAGQNLEVLAIYDTDSDGKIAQDKLVKNWLTRFHDKTANALSLGTMVGLPNRDFSIEDLFSDVFYLSFVEAVHGKQLAAAGVDLKKLPPGEQLVKRVETLFDSASLKFNKKLVCKALCGKVRSMKNVSELPAQTMKQADALFSAINKEFIGFQTK